MTAPDMIWDRLAGPNANYRKRKTESLLNAIICTLFTITRISWILAHNVLIARIKIFQTGGRTETETESSMYMSSGFGMEASLWSTDGINGWRGRDLPLDCATRWRWVAALGRTWRCKWGWWWIRGWCAAPVRRWPRWRVLGTRREEGGREMSSHSTTRHPLKMAHKAKPPGLFKEKFIYRSVKLFSFLLCNQSASTSFYMCGCWDVLPMSWLSSLSGRVSDIYTFVYFPIHRKTIPDFRAADQVAERRPARQKANRKTKTNAICRAGQQSGGGGGDTTVQQIVSLVQGLWLKSVKVATWWLACNIILQINFRGKRCCFRKKNKLLKKTIYFMALGASCLGNCIVVPAILVLLWASVYNILYIPPHIYHIYHIHHIYHIFHHIPFHHKTI